MSQSRFSAGAMAALALAVCGGSLQAAIVANSSTLTLYCDTVLGPTPATMGIKLSAAGSAVNVTVTAPTGPIVLPSPALESVASATTATNFSFVVAPGCKGATNGQTEVLTFTPAGGTAVTVTATLNVTNSASALAPSPSAVTITCNLTGTTYTPGSAQTVNVTSPANSGTPFTVDNTVNVLPAWLSVTPLTGGAASATPVALTVVAKSGCGGLAVGSTTFGVHLLNAPAPDKILPVTIQVGGANTLSASVSPISLTYTAGTTPSATATTNISATAAYFSVDATTLPVWLNVTPANGTATTGSPVTLTFAVTAGAKTLALGGYSANVHLKVSGELDLVVPVSLEVQNPAATLSVVEGITRTLNWTIGTTLPSLVVTPVSSDSPIPFTITTTAGTLSPQVSATSGLAYNFGTPLTVTFLQSIFGAAAPGSALTGSVIITPASGSPVTVAITVNVKAAGANITSLSPSTLPTATSGTFTVALTGSGFVSSGSPTTVGIVTGGLIVSDSNIAVTVVNPSAILLAITVPTSTDPYLPFSGTGGTITIGACNPQGSTCSTPGQTVTLTIGVNPIIQAVTSAASFSQATPPALTPVAPYDILSVFGTNFCVSGGTGCTGGSATLYGTLNPVTLGYLTSLSPDAAGATQRNVTVTFQTHGRNATAIATAPLLFVTNNQINLVVPDEVKTYIGQTVDMVVSFGYGTSSATLLSSSTYSVTIAATDPGAFSVSGDGQGDAAALSPTYSLISNASPAVVRNTGTDSDVIQLYVSGLGRPDSDGTGTGYSAHCMPTDGYWAAVNTATSVSPALTSNDGLVLQSTLYPTGDIQPCLKYNSPDVPTVTVGGISAPVAFAGWVTGTVAGLYQINVQLPISTSLFTDAAGDTAAAATSTPAHLLVVITANSVTSQPTGLNIWVVRGLKMTSSGAITGVVNAAWGTAAVNAVDGDGTITYAVAGGSTLPAGLALSSSTGAITGTPTATGTTTVVFTATDGTSNCVGTVSITFTVTAS